MNHQRAAVRATRVLCLKRTVKFRPFYRCSLQVCSGFYYPPPRLFRSSSLSGSPFHWESDDEARRGDGRALPQPCRTNRVTDRRLPLQPHHAQKKKKKTARPSPPQSTAPRLPNFCPAHWAVPFLHQSPQFKFQTPPHGRRRAASSSPRPRIP